MLLCKVLMLCLWSSKLHLSWLCDFSVVEEISGCFFVLLAEWTAWCQLCTVPFGLVLHSEWAEALHYNFCHFHGRDHVPLGAGGVHQGGRTFAHKHCGIILRSSEISCLSHAYSCIYVLLLLLCLLCLFILLLVHATLVLLLYCLMLFLFLLKLKCWYSFLAPPLSSNGVAFCQATTVNKNLFPITWLLQ